MIFFWILRLICVEGGEDRGFDSGEDPVFEFLRSR